MATNMLYAVVYANLLLFIKNLVLFAVFALDGDISTNEDPVFADVTLNLWLGVICYVIAIVINIGQSLSTKGK